MNPALSADALFTKSQVYVQRAFRAQSATDFEEYQLWASLALELLGKAALASVHPALVADPQHFESLFAACGCPISPDVKTITAKTLFSRIGHLDKNFDARRQRFCEQMSLRRNSELHSGESPFSGMSPEVWEPEYWGTIEVLLVMQEKNLDCWLGMEEAKAPAAILLKASQAREWVVSDRTKRAKEDFLAKYRDPSQRKKLLEDSKNFSWWDHRGDFYISADKAQPYKCPACEATAFLLGTLWNEEVVDTDETFYGSGYDDDSYVEYFETVEKSFAVEEFYCPVCKLHFFGTAEIEAAGMPREFTSTEERERQFEEDYGND
jgi:hypothetical protein